MAFAPDMYVFPGGRVDPGDADPSLIARSLITRAEAAAALGGDLAPEAAIAAFVAAIRECFEEAGVLLADVGRTDSPVEAARTALLRGEASFATIATTLDLRLRTDLLVPLSRWVTPPNLPRRFDARFFAARLPEGVEPSLEGGEVVAHTWLRPLDALAAMADGRLAMWLPTSTTLQQLAYATSIEDVRERATPWRLGEVRIEPVTSTIIRVVMPAAGGVAGQPVCAYLVGHRRFVLIDPGDPTGPGLDRAIELVAAASGAIEAVVLTHVDPGHAAGAEAAAEVLKVPVFTGPDGGRPLPYAVHELADFEVVAAGDVPLRAIHTPGLRPDHTAFVVGDGAYVIAGDLDGVRGTRSIAVPRDDAAMAASIERLRGLAPDAIWLTGHPSALGDD
jgi:glyoxylase-like metal-dependent hydrolase (beta-lactamase superfamily II)/8-oxo-dGTP pyrophosphatase MutT (NUDIX family)